MDQGCHSTIIDDCIFNIDEQQHVDLQSQEVVEPSNEKQDVIEWIESNTLFKDCRLQIYRNLKSIISPCQLFIDKQDCNLLFDFSLQCQQLVNTCSEQILFIKKREIAKRGLAIVTPLPPISRIEYNDFESSPEFEYSERERRELLLSVFQGYLAQIVPVLRSLKQPINEFLLYPPSSAFSASSIQTHFMQALHDELIQFEDYYTAIQTINKPAELLLTSLCALFDCCVWVSQLVFLYATLESTFHHCLQLPSIHQPHFPAVPTLEQKQVQPKTSNVISTPSVKESVLGVLESMYLQVADLSEEQVVHLETFHQLALQWGRIEQLLKVEVAEKPVQYSPVEWINSKPSEPIAKREEEDPEVWYVYQGVGEERREREDQTQVPSFRPPPAFLHELKSVLLSSKKERKTVIVGDDIDFDQDEAPPTPPPSRPQISFFSFITEENNSY